jgi:hypothetical protein
LFGWALVLAAPADAQSDSVSVTATANGQDVASADSGNPLRLEPGTPVDIAVVVTNRGSTPVVVQDIELGGRVLGLSFFSYATTVDHTVAPGATDTVRYRLNLTGLSGEATGLIGGRLTVIDSGGHAIAVIPTVTDVRGSLISVYGLFGIALVVLTALAIVDASLALVRRRVSPNRWRRGLRLLIPGIGIAMVLAFSASVARLWVPETSRWLMIAAISAAVFFAVGYLSPTPEHDDDQDVDDSPDSDDPNDVAETPAAPAAADGHGV